jgi:RNA methyltransferase, TrmH family
MNPITALSSRDNPWVKRWRQLAQDATAYRSAGEVWLEGDHLIRALLARGRQPQWVVGTEAGLTAATQWGLAPSVRQALLPPALMAHISGLPSAPAIAAVHALPAGLAPLPGLATVVLDRLQDPGNVGSVLRSAAAFGFGQVLALQGTAALWSPKVLRAGMGAHFALHLVEGADASALSALRLPLLATSSHQGEWLHQARLPWPCAWLLGHEGQGVAAPLLALAERQVRIAQPGGEESLNVAAAAAICLHASAATRL